MYLKIGLVLALVAALSSGAVWAAFWAATMLDVAPVYPLAVVAALAVMFAWRMGAFDPARGTDNQQDPPKT